jgi:predicted lipoprotein with Yx(FWY)xxD motif
MARSSGDVSVFARRTVRRPATALLMLAVAAIAVLVFAASAETKRGAAGGTLTVRSSEYGRVVFDGRGYVLYGFTADRKRRSVCSGACAAAWPPYIVSRAPTAGLGIEKSLLGTIRRADGRRQVTYAGRPLYYYVGDRRPGQILCQDVFEFGGDWLVVRPSGTLVR